MKKSISSSEKISSPCSARIQGRLLALLMVFILALISSPSLAQAGTISGTVTNTCSGKAIFGATVSVIIVPGKTPVAVSDTTDKNGDYSITDTRLNIGSSYTIAASYSGYETQSQSVTIPAKFPYEATRNFALVSVPTVSTGTANSGYPTYAYLNGSIDPNGSSTSYYFQYGTTTSYGSTTSSQSAGSGSSTVTIGPVYISGLSTGHHVPLPIACVQLLQDGVRLGPQLYNESSGTLCHHQFGIIHFNFQGDPEWRNQSERGSHLLLFPVWDNNSIRFGNNYYLRWIRNEPGSGIKGNKQSVLLHHL
jgi:hypothetical protein